MSEIVIRLGVVEFAVFLVLLVGALWLFRVGVLDAAEAAAAGQVRAIEAAAAAAVARFRAEADRIAAEASDRIAGTRRAQVAKVYQAIRAAAAAVGGAFTASDDTRHAYHNRVELTRLMETQGVPQRSREDVLEIWLRDRENGLLALERQLRQIEIDRAAQAVDDARTTALLNELYLAPATATRLRSELTTLVRLLSDLRAPHWGDEERAQLLDTFGDRVDAACDLLRDDLQGEGQTAVA